MLGTDFRFGTESWWQRVVRLLLGEALLGFLALMSAALTLFPMLFTASASGQTAIAIAQWVIVGWFGVEYLVALISARSKRLFLRDAWRWIDLATVVIPLLSVLPGVSNLLRSSPVLRLARLARLLTLGVRASGIVVRHHREERIAAATAGPAHITRRPDGARTPPVPVTRDALLNALQNGTEGWYHVTNPSPEDLHAIGAAANLPPVFLQTHFVSATHPHIAASHETVALFLWAPETDYGAGAVERQPMLIVMWKNRVVSFSRGPVAAIEAAVPPPAEFELADASLPTRVTASLLERIVNDNEALVSGFEQHLRSLEDVPLRESRPAFFEQTFRLKKHLSAAQWDLWRLKAVLTQLSDARTPLPAESDASRAVFARFSASADYLYETVVNTREDLLAVIDLHLNVVSFDMNRVMRVLAVVSVLGLIPAVIGGLLGMNLIDNPWHFTLPQVSFVVVFGMLSGLYFFLVKGWLR